MVDKYFKQYPFSRSRRLKRAIVKGNKKGAHVTAVVDENNNRVEHEVAGIKESLDHKVLFGKPKEQKLAQNELKRLGFLKG